MKKNLLLLFMLFIGFSISAQYISEGFEGSFPPTNWTLINNGTGNDWTQNTSSTYANTGTKSAQYVYNFSNAADAWLISDGIVLTAGEVIDWSFYERVRSSSYAEDFKLTIGTSATVAGQTTTLIDLSGLTNILYVQQSGSYTVPSTGTYFIGMNCYSVANQWNLYIDDLLVETQPTCTNPTASISNITDVTADASWAAAIGASNYDWEVVPFGNMQGVGVVASGNTSALTVNITGLMALTDYDFFIKSDCMAGYAVPVSFSTLATPPDYCGGDIHTDSGGDSGNYSSDENISYLICPDVPTDKVTITFSSFEVEGNGNGTCYDELKIYDGMDSSAPQIGPAAGYCYESSTVGTSYPGGGLGVPIVSSDGSGCIFMAFTSDGSVNKAGWEASISCGAYTAPSSQVTLTSSGTTSGTSTNAVPGANGYTYYENPNNLGTFFMAIKWDASGNGDNDASAATVTVDLDAMDGTATDGTFSTWTMKRYWNVDMGGNALVDPVDVKFFYDSAEKTATEMAAGNGPDVEIPAWFKTDGSVWDNSPAPGNPAIDVIELTDANAAGTMENGVVFAEFTGVASFSGGSFASGIGINGASALPVSLVSFTGKAMDVGNKLYWSTESESNSSHFEIERKDPRTNVWEQIGMVKSNTMSTELRKYDVMDDSPLLNNFYRLKMVDQDGQFMYSDVINLTRNVDVNLISSVYPNPTNSDLNIEYLSNSDRNISIFVVDINGKSIQAIANNSVYNGVNLLKVDVKSLTAGVYMLQVVSDVDTQVVRFVKN